MSTITLSPLDEDALEDLHDLWIENDLWPAGEFFYPKTTLEDLEEASDNGELKAFKAEMEDGKTLFGVVVTEGKVHVDIHAMDGEELTPEDGAATLSALVEWVFANTDADTVHKYLDSEKGVIHDQFAAWGFNEEEDVLLELDDDSDSETAEAAAPAPVAEEAPEEIVAEAEESSDEAAEASAESEEGEAAEEAVEAVDHPDGEEEDELYIETALTWKLYSLKKADFSGSFSI